MFRGAENAPARRNWLHMPIGLTGARLTVIVSGTDHFHRPKRPRSNPQMQTAPYFAQANALYRALSLAPNRGTALPNWATHPSVAASGPR